MRTYIYASIIALVGTASYAAEPPVTTKALGELLGYPSESIQVKEVTEQANERQKRKGRPLAISVHHYSSEDGSFAPMNIAVGEGGTLLTPEMKEWCEKAAKNPDMRGTVRAISKEDVGTGYTGVWMLGSGGSGHMAFIHVPSVKRDVQVTLSMSSDHKTKAGTEAYVEMIKSEKVNEAVGKCVIAVAESLVAK